MFFLIATSARLPAIEVRAGVPAEEWVAILEPSFLRAPVATSLPQSKTTLLVAATMVDGEPRRFRTAEFQALKVDMDKFTKQAALNASRVLEKLEPEILRDEKGVVTHAVLRSEDPLTSTVILSPDFAEKFEELFGTETLVAVPNRNTVYIFPKLAGAHKGFAEVILSEYRNSAWPCSLELFEVSARGVRATGSFDPHK